MPARSLPVIAQFVALALAWGASFLFMKIGLEGLSPAQLVLGRLGGGALALVAFSVLKRMPLPRSAAVWAHATVVGVLFCVVPFLLFAWAEEHVSSALASIYSATTPLMTMLVALFVLPEERPTRWRVAGLLTGLVGVLVILGPWRGNAGGSALAQAACLLATASYGAAFVYVRRFLAPRDLPAVVVATMQVGISAAMMLALTPLIASQPVELSARVVISVALLGVVGTGLAFVWNTNVVSAWGATTASTVTYLNPVVGMMLGIAVLGERLSWNQPVGALLVIVGILLTSPGVRSWLTRMATRFGWIPT